MEQKTDGERLATLEEQVRGMRYDFGGLREEMKQTMGTFIQHVTTMQKEYVSRGEFDREMRHRDEKEVERMERVEDLEGKVEKLRGRPTWSVSLVLTVAVGVIATLGTILSAYITNMK